NDGNGSSAHRSLIDHVVTHYRHDNRVRAVVVFGSVAAGTWHELSDVDLDIVTGDSALTRPVRPTARRLRLYPYEPARAMAAVVAGMQEAPNPGARRRALLAAMQRAPQTAVAVPDIRAQVLVLAGRITEPCVD